MLFTSFLNRASAGISADSLDADNDGCPDKWVSRGFVIDIGFNQLLNTPDLMRLHNWRSKGVNIYYFYYLHLWKKKLSFNPGLGLGLDNYSFRNNVRFSTLGDTLSIFLDPDPERAYRKSKMGLTWLDIPLEIRYRTSSRSGKAFKIAVGGKVGFLIKSTSKVKFERGMATIKEKESHFFYMNPIRYGLTGRVGYGFFSFFAYYSLVELFEKNKGPEVTPVMVGISLSTF